MAKQVTYLSILRDSGIYSIAVVASRLVALVMAPVYTRYLTPADYGIMELLDLGLSLAAMLVGIRLGQSLFYYYFHAPTQQLRDRHLSTALISSILLGSAAGLLAFLSSGAASALIFGTPQYSGYARLAAVSLAFSFPSQIGLLCARALNRPVVYVAASLCQMAIALFFNVVLLVFFGLGVKAMLWGQIVSSGMVAVYMCWYVLWPIKTSFDFGILLQQFRYSFPLTLSSLGDFILHFGDRYFLRKAVSLSQIGIYSLAYKIGMLIPLAHLPFALYWGSQVVPIVRGPDGEKIYVRVCTYLTLGLTLVAVLLALFSRPLLAVLVTPAFRSAAVWVPWLVLAYVVRAVGAHIRSVFVVEARTGLEARVTWIGAAVCLAAYAALIPTFQVWGAVFATLLGFVVILFFSVWQAQSVRKFAFEFGRIARITAYGIATGVFFELVRPQRMWLEVLVGVAFAVAFLTTVWVSGLLAESEKRALRAGITAIRQRLASSAA
jgi:O-antigen/teichoic acid export membrane protein